MRPFFTRVVTRLEAVVEVQLDTPGGTSYDRI
jgi:hypothetical protein